MAEKPYTGPRDFLTGAPRPATKTPRGNVGPPPFVSPATAAQDWLNEQARANLACVTGAFLDAHPGVVTFLRAIRNNGTLTEVQQLKIDELVAGR